MHIFLIKYTAIYKILINMRYSLIQDLVTRHMAYFVPAISAEEGSYVGSENNLG